ncbi:MAG: adenine/guanine/hypoxanthine permease [Thermacetogenium sp.]|jgi:AGZA family xanthine/uracil permease-like MFS transporter|nr:adenine/guanine/hypoxanthine permease [Thermacetogenium sp.]MDN5375098.1 adenine/guanine/hypoxanthine permease [Thermacetogenium sp.]
MERFFKLKQNGTTVSTEIIAGLTTFFTMSYIIFVNPAILSQTGIPWGAVFLATIIASAVGTLVMGLFANVPYALAPGMGLNAFFTYTVCFGLGFTWQQALTMVFICGLINIVLTVTKVRKVIITAIPRALQSAIGGGIGIFIAYIGIKSAGLINFTADPGTYTVLEGGTAIINSSAVPALVDFNNPTVLLSLIGLALTVILLVLRVKGAILLGIIGTTIIGIPMGIVDVSEIGVSTGIAASFAELGSVFGTVFTSSGLPSLFADSEKILIVLITIFAFSLTDIFDTVGTFIGTGRKTGIFSEEDEQAMLSSSGFKSKMDRALFADAIATSIGALFGTSNTTTYVESAAGIGAGGRTGLTSLVTALLFLLAIFLAPVAGIVPSAATAPALIVVGIMMMAAFKDIKWDSLDDAIPAFFAGIFMAFCYSISYGIAAGFIFYCLVKLCKGQLAKVHPVVTVSTLFFILNFIVQAVI